MAIYPVIKGQKSATKNSIPPRTSTATTSGQDTPNLIDFSHDNTPATPQEAKPSSETKAEVDPRHKSTAEIQTMLSATGSPAHSGPLIDFHDDLKTSLPQKLSRGDTEESQDEFVDAQE